MIIALLAWILVAVEPGSLKVEEPARYETREECELGRVQYEQQHVVVTWCEERR